MSALDIHLPEAGREPSPVVSLAPVTIDATARRGTDMQLRISAPVRGGDLPVVLFSHGYGSSHRAYGPLVDHWAASGFVVVQPTHLDSRIVGIAQDDPRRRVLWRHRVEDLRRVLDELPQIVGRLPGLAGRADVGRVAVAGHSFGGQSAGVLLGLRVTDPATGEGPDLSDPRVTAGVLLATAGRGGSDVRPEMAELFPWLHPSFEHLTTPTFVVAGDHDVSPLTTRGADWTTDPFRLSPGARHLLTLTGAEHSLGGIPGYDAAETTDQHPGRVAAVQRLTSAFLRSELHQDDRSWNAGAADLARAAPELGTIESKTE